jgi:AcrR family transcriptional regulator
LRETQKARTRDQIVEACVALMTAGRDLTFAAVAREAGVQERTVYRHFPTKRDLEQALWGWIVAHLTRADLSARTPGELIDSMRESFAGFDAGAPLIQAMLHTPQGLTIRLGQQDARRAMFEACIDAALPDLAPEPRMRAAAALQVLYSATAWELLRNFWGLDGAEAADVVEQAIRAMLAGLRPPGRQPTS